jgi:hypothetical protein
MKLMVSVALLSFSCVQESKKRMMFLCSSMRSVFTSCSSACRSRSSTLRSFTWFHATSMPSSSSNAL